MSQKLRMCKNRKAFVVRVIYFGGSSEQNKEFRLISATPFPTNTIRPSNGFVNPFRHFLSTSAYTETLSPASISKMSKYKTDYMTITIMDWLHWPTAPSKGPI